MHHNPVPSSRGQIKQAQELFADFRGHQAENLQRVKLANPKTGLVIGEMDGVLYTAVRDGKEERYIHEFKDRNRPLLVASHDGQSLHIVGGKYEFTDRGIED